MHKLALAFLGPVLLLSSLVCPAQIYPSDPGAVAFIKSMYNLEQYEDYSFLKSHCTKKMLKKLEDNFGYECDGTCYATWLFRSGAHDHWYAYTALDMGWKFTNWVYLIKSGNTFLIDDVITVYNELRDN